MKFNLCLRRPSSSMGHSSSQPKHPDPQLHAGNLNADVEKQRPADTGSQWAPPSSAAPPPYTRAVAPGIQINGRPTSHSSAAAGSSGASETFASNRLRDVAYLQAPMRQESKENALEMLRTYDTVVIMDDSGSMLRDDRWEQACEALSNLAQIAATYDRDGIDIHFLNHPKSGMNVKDPNAVRQLFRHVQPRGLTPIANKLDVLVGDYVEKLERAARRKHQGDSLALKGIKPVNFIVITDGAPTDEPEDSIVSLARRLDRGNFPLAQVGIQFVQIGDDKEATEFLKELDDALSGTHGVRDIVDTTPFLGIKLTAEMLIKILLGGVNRRVDRRGAQAVMSV
jgi:Mg-chelatase subunit ChlD